MKLPEPLLDAALSAVSALKRWLEDSKTAQSIDKIAHADAHARLIECASEIVRDTEHVRTLVPHLIGQLKGVTSLSGGTIQGSPYVMASTRYNEWGEKASELHGRAIPIKSAPDKFYTARAEDMSKLYSSLQRDRIEAAEIRTMVDTESAKLEARRASLVAERQKRRPLG